MLDQSSADYLAAIVAKDVTELTEDDKAFLRARASYLSTEQAAKYADVLGGVPTATSSATEDTSSDPLENMTKAEIQTKLQELGVDYASGLNKPELIEILRANLPQ